MKTLKYYILKIVLLFGILSTAIYAKAQSDTTIFYPTEIKGIPISLIKKKMAYEGTWKYESRDTTFSRGEGYSIPEKCTLTRISHDPYYEIDMDL